MSNGLDSLPTLFLERLRNLLPARGVEMCLASFQTPRGVGLRVNTLRTTVPQVLSQLTQLDIHPQPVAWLSEGFYIPHVERERLTHSRLAEDGSVYIQNITSLLPTYLLRPHPTHRVLDMAAAPGGKTLHMAAMMANQGYIGAVEAVRSRMYRLQENIRRHGVTNTKVFLMDGRKVGYKTPGQFDRVLLDAPCTAEARFRVDHPQSFAYWSPRKIREQARKQMGLLAAGIHALRPGGELVYCTCCFSPEENESVIDRQLRRFGDAIEVLPIDLPIEHVEPGVTHWEGHDFSPELSLSRRILPTPDMDGLFICHLRKCSPLSPRAGRC